MTGRKLTNKKSPHCPSLTHRKTQDPINGPSILSGIFYIFPQSFQANEKAVFYIKAIYVSFSVISIFLSRGLRVELMDGLKCTCLCKHFYIQEHINHLSNFSGYREF
jgi:hypothetical protein